MSDFEQQYRALTDGAGMVDFCTRSRIGITGEDRISFLHNMCTNDISGLAAGQGCEAFLTNVQGKVLGHVLVFSGPDSLLLETTPGQAEGLIAHLDRYIIREDVQLTDLTSETGEILLSGARSEQLLAQLIQADPPVDLFACCEIQLGEVSTTLCRVDLAGTVGFLIQCPSSSFAGLWETMVGAGAEPCQQQALEAVRIEAGTPQYGQDICEETLPQEVDRDARAISFTAGCYLGQETVARIDALGHVNKTLCGVRFSRQATPSPGDELTLNDKVIGRITSCSFSPRLDAPLALAYLHRGQNIPGTKLDGAEVVALPV